MIVQCFNLTTICCQWCPPELFEGWVITDNAPPKSRIKFNGGNSKPQSSERTTLQKKLNYEYICIYIKEPFIILINHSIPVHTPSCIDKVTFDSIYPQGGTMSYQRRKHMSPPYILNYINLKKPSSYRGMWIHPPIYVELTIYFFSIQI